MHRPNIKLRTIFILFSAVLSVSLFAASSFATSKFTAYVLTLRVEDTVDQASFAPTAGTVTLGTSSFSGRSIDVQLAIYDKRSLELSWARVPDAVRYRLSRDGRVVQDDDGISCYTTGVNLGPRIDYTLEALDRLENVLRTQIFSVNPTARVPLLGNTDATNPSVPDPAEQYTVRVDYDIMIPVYVSEALQVRLVRGHVEVAAPWLGDELWSASEELPTDTETAPVVTFYDGNGRLVLGTAALAFRTGTNAMQSVQVTAEQFDTEM